MINFLNVLSKWQEFNTLLSQSKQDPQALLENELKKRGLNKQQLTELIQQAQSLSYLFKSK